VVSLGFSTDTTVASEVEALRFILEDLKFSYRNCGSTTVAFMMATGQIDAVLGFGARSWDVMAGLAIVDRMGGKCSIDWNETGLEDRLAYVAWTPEIVGLFEPAL
jgi:fructose-1,6-bisphosphatase/inositol monophosphatase family enzyme